MQSYQAIRSQIISKAWKDETFKKRLMMNPKEVLNEFGLKSSGVQIPNNPSAIDGLTDQEMILRTDRASFQDCTGDKWC